MVMDVNVVRYISYAIYDDILNMARVTLVNSVQGSFMGILARNTYNAGEHSILTVKQGGNVSYPNHDSIDYFMGYYSFICTYVLDRSCAIRGSVISVYSSVVVVERNYNSQMD